MKKKILIPIIALFVVLSVLFVPIPGESYDDGGTREYNALTYKIVDWNKISGGGVYEKTKIYFGKDKKASVDALWQKEMPTVASSVFFARITEIKGDTVTVEPLEGEVERNSCLSISFSKQKLSDISVSEGNIVKIGYNGAIRETYPASIDVVFWERVTDLHRTEYTDKWLDKTEQNKCDEPKFSDIRITEIYSNCFFATTVVPLPYKIKLNGVLSDEWCVGDTVTVQYTNLYYDEETKRIEADFSDVAASDFELEPNKAYKPVIYLYPEKKTEASVKLELDGKLSCTYPEYKNGWQVTAYPDGTLTDKNGTDYNYLYWEGDINADYDLSKGFCIRGEDTATFLEYALEKLGLNRREANEFIVFWSPYMQENEYNVISFQQRSYTDAARLDITPKPDTLIRVFMTWYAADSYVEIENQILNAPERKGFTAIEWGGTEIEQ